MSGDWPDLKEAAGWCVTSAVSNQSIREEAEKVRTTRTRGGRGKRELCLPNEPCGKSWEFSFFTWLWGRLLSDCFAACTGTVLGRWPAVIVC